MIINNIVLNKKSIDYIEKRGLQKQYKKCKKFILTGNFKQVDFKLREPKSEKIFYFRINKQYRVWGRIEEDTLKIFYIDNHS